MEKILPVVVVRNMIFLFDIDGTLADISHRLHFIEDRPKDYGRFFRACVDDTPIWPVIWTLRMLKKAGATILLVSGRSDIVRQETKDWMKEFEVPFDGLYMRRDKDHREDTVVKAELLEELGKEWNLEDVVAIFDDRDSVVDMYREKGYKVFRVEEGDY